MQAYLSLFFAAFIAATLLPMGSEALLAALAAQGYTLFHLWWVATLGNTLGSVVNYLLGRYLLHFQDRRWFPFKADKMSRSQHWFQKYGTWSLLFAWLPLVGDILTFIAGVLRVHFVWFVVLVFIGKGARYAMILVSADWLING